MKPFLKSDKSPSRYCMAKIRQARKEMLARRIAAMPRKSILKRFFGL